MQNDEAGAFRRLMECVEGGLDFSGAYSESDAVADYLTLRPDADPADVPLTLAPRLYAMHRIWGESVTGFTIEKPSKR